jgi:hypothetical protein
MLFWFSLWGFEFLPGNSKALFFRCFLRLLQEKNNLLVWFKSVPSNSRKPLNN